jgi:5-methylthioadenosine/S-adenosylhomocysteine deaminase
VSATCHTGDRTILRHGFVVSMDEAIGDVPDCDILIEDGRIAAVRPGLPGADAREIDASSAIVVPGFVDTHRHTWQTALRGALSSCTLDDYLTRMMRHLGPTFRAEDVYIGNLLGAVEAVNAGITTLVDWSHCSFTPEHADAAVAALRRPLLECV